MDMNPDETEGEEGPEGTGVTEFCGFRSYVLPKGNYQIVQEEEENGASAVAAEAEERVFYLAGDDVFVEIESNDADAILHIQDTTADDGGFNMELVSEKEEVATSYQVMNEVGMMHTIEVVGGAAQVTVTKANGIQIQTSEPEKVDILVDGHEVSVEEGQINVNFEASEDESPWNVDEVSTSNILVDENYVLTGTATASVILNLLEEKQGTVVATLCDEKE